MPADKRRFHIVAHVQPGEFFRALRHFAEIAPEICASVAIEAARARMNVNINGAHDLPLDERGPTATDLADCLCKMFDLFLPSR